MKIEVLVSTMYQKDFSLAERMKIQGPCVIVNQTDFASFPRLNRVEPKINFVSSDERGLSRSRNMALKHATGDICLLADDDIIYKDEYVNIVERAYEILQDADIVIFDYCTDTSHRRPTFISRQICELGYLKSLKVNSIRISFRRQAIISKGISFNTDFGAGSTFVAGEENIFLFDCLRNGLHIYYFPEVISYASLGNSSWFNGYNEEYFISKGAFSYALLKRFYLFFILQFAIRKVSLYRHDVTMISAISYMLKGKKIYYNHLLMNR